MLARVSLPTGGGRVYGVTRVEIRQQEYAHDIVLVTCVGLDKRRVRKNAPISVTFGTGGVFTGYVLTVSTGKKRTDPVVISCIGPTSVCRNGHQRSWAGKTDSQIVQSIGSLVKLHVAVEATKTKHKMLNQAGKSDWQFMVERAKANGFVVYPRGPQIRFHSRSFELDHYANAAPHVASVIQFTPDITDVLASGGPKATVSVSGVDASGQVHTGTGGTAAATVFNTKSVATTLAEAQERAVADAQLNAWTYRAHVEVNGDARYRVGGPIFFSDVPGDYEGYWVVQKATHIITSQRYTTLLVVGIDRLHRGAPPTASEEKVSDGSGGVDSGDLQILLMDPAAGFDPELDNVVVPEDLSVMGMTISDLDLFPDSDPYEGVAPVAEEKQWVVAAQPVDDDGYVVLGLSETPSEDDGYEVTGIGDPATVDDGYIPLDLTQQPPDWLVAQVYG